MEKLTKFEHFKSLYANTDAEMPGSVTCTCTVAHTTTFEVYNGSLKMQINGTYRVAHC